MPLWVIYHTTDTFTSPSQKQAFAKDITGYYTSNGLPDFYVAVNFIALDSENVYRAGQQAEKFVRISIDHIAVRLDDSDEVYKRVSDRMNAILQRHLDGKGWNWEFHVDETERRLWRIDGLVPPPFRSQQEKEWFENRRAGPWK